MDFEQLKKETVDDILRRIKEVVEEEVEATIDDLKCEIEHYKEKFEDLERDVEDNYKPISYEEQIGYNERDFI